MYYSNINSYNEGVNDIVTQKVPKMSLLVGFVQLYVYSDQFVLS